MLDPARAVYAAGAYGEDSGYPWMDQNLKDTLLGMRPARELVARERPDVPLERIRGQLGGLGVSDDELLLRTIMKGEDEIRAMRAAGPPRPYHLGAAPLVTLLEELGKHRQVRYVRVERGSDSLVVRNRPGLPT